MISSGPEMSLCSEAVFGTDIDFLSWDYGMTDGGNHWRILHYYYRAGLNPGRPAVLGVHLGGKNFRKQRLQDVDNLGMAVFEAPDAIFDEMMKAIPDTEGLTEEQMNQMPEMVRNFKCFGKVESGDPNCSKEKYNMALCPSRKGRANWHPGV
jgi:hypothetical protein